MRVGLFVPCYIDQLYPRVGFATLRVLEGCGLDVEFPSAQTCCGQPVANAGFPREARPVAERFLEVFEPYDAIVAPSGSCVATVRHHYRDWLGPSEALTRTATRTYELCEFLTDVVDILDTSGLTGCFPHRVGLHHACHGLRELRMATGSERVVPTEQHHDKARRLLDSIEGLELCDLTRPDECCGFGGSFAIKEEAVSVRMGLDRIEDHEHAGAEIITSLDASCLMHLNGLLRRRKNGPRVMHIAEILASVQETA
ncbi:(Fe-S)-binding protein [Myxococcota bacterium]|nr:(Fe-S)-binding protein [Myxococcota bacterium]